MLITPPTLRDYQERGVTDIRAALQSPSKFVQGQRNRRILYVLPTGGGKTIVFCYLAWSANQKGKKVMILVHRDSLFTQTAEKLLSFGVPHGLIGAGYATDYSKNVQVCKIGTMVNRLDKFVPDTIIIDECHHTNASQYMKIVQAYPNAVILGVTATPIRTDGTGLGVGHGGIYEEIVLGPTPRELIELGYLVAPRYFYPDSGLDLSKIKCKGGDFDKSELAFVMDKPKITGNFIEYYQKLCDGVPAVAFCVSVEHSIHVADAFRDSGYNAAYISGKMSKEEIRATLNKFASGEIHVITSCDLISEGTDIPKIGAAILLRPTMSLSLYLQQVGRALRPCEGKEHAIILDHVGNITRHGDPTEDREWTLEGVKKIGKRVKNEGEEMLKITTCKNCYYVYPGTLSECPECGKENPKKVRIIKTVDGELVELVNKPQVRIKTREEVRLELLELIRKENANNPKKVGDLILEKYRECKAMDHRIGWMYFAVKTYFMKLLDSQMPKLPEQHKSDLELVDLVHTWAKAWYKVRGFDRYDAKNELLVSECNRMVEEFLKKRTL